MMKPLACATACGMGTGPAPINSSGSVGRMAVTGVFGGGSIGRESRIAATEDLGIRIVCQTPPKVSRTGHQVRPFEVSCRIPGSPRYGRRHAARFVAVSRQRGYSAARVLVLHMYDQVQENDGHEASRIDS